jgi:hypothetical protein
VAVTKPSDFSSLVAMKNAVLRLMAIVIVSCAVIFSILLAIRWLGSGQEYAPVNHKLMQQQPLVILETDQIDNQLPPQSEAAIRKAHELCPRCILKVDSRLSLDNKPYIFAEDDLKPGTGETGFFSLKEASSIAKLHYNDVSRSPILTLTELVEKFPHVSFYVVIHSRDASKLRHFLGGLEARASKQNTILGSPYRQILKEAREKRPRWLFATPPSYLMRIQVMASLMIEPMADIWPDLLIFDPNSKRDRPTDAIIKEFQKRFKPVIVKTNEFLEQYPTPDFGTYTGNVEFAQSVFKSEQTSSEASQ